MIFGLPDIFPFFSQSLFYCVCVFLKPPTISRLLRKEEGKRALSPWPEGSLQRLRGSARWAVDPRAQALSGRNRLLGLSVRKERSEAPEGLAGIRRGSWLPFGSAPRSAAWQGPACELRQVGSILTFRRGCQSRGLFARGCARVGRGFCKARVFLRALPLSGRAEKELLFCF